MQRHHLLADAERAIVRTAILSLLDQGCQIAVNDGAAVVLKRSGNAEAVIEAALETETGEALLIVFAKNAPKGERCGWLHFVYGNDGWDVLSDYTTNLEPALAPVTTVANEWEKKLAA